MQWFVVVGVLILLHIYVAKLLSLKAYIYMVYPEYVKENCLGYNID